MQQSICKRELLCVRVHFSALQYKNDAFCIAICHETCLTALIKIKSMEIIDNKLIGELLAKAGVSARLRRNLDLPYPHSRSDENIMELAAMRGGQWGMEFAAFEEVLREH